MEAESRRLTGTAFKVERAIRISIDNRACDCGIRVIGPKGLLLANGSPRSGPNKLKRLHVSTYGIFRSTGRISARSQGHGSSAPACRFEASVPCPCDRAGCRSLASAKLRHSTRPWPTLFPASVTRAPHTRLPLQTSPPLLSPPLSLPTSFAPFTPYRASTCLTVAIGPRLR